MALTYCGCDHPLQDHVGVIGRCRTCSCPDAHDWHDRPDRANQEGAPRQAGTVTQTADADQARHALEDHGVMTSVRQLTPASAGHAVRLLVADGPTGGVLYLDPQQAADLAHQLLSDAQEAIHADRTVRRG